MNILAMNSGSSSLKFKVVEFDESADAAKSRQPSIHYEGSVEEIGSAAELMLRRDGKPVTQFTRGIATHAEAVRCMLDMLEDSSRQEGQTFHIEAVGHRVVHGGDQIEYRLESTAKSLPRDWTDAEHRRAGIARRCLANSFAQPLPLPPSGLSHIFISPFQLSAG